jgi:hypothetical protein
MGSVVADSLVRANEERTQLVTEVLNFMVNAALKIMVSGTLTGVLSR